MRFPLSTALLLLMVAGLAAGCSDTIEPGNTSLGKGPVVTVPVMVAEEKSLPQIYEALGTVSARVAATVSSKLMGTVLAVAVREGDRVQQGDLLVALDDRQVAAQLAQAQALLAGEAITQADFEGVQARQRQSQAALTQAEAAVKAAQSRVQQARAAVDAARVARQDARVSAPFEGRVTAKLVDAGDLAAPGKPLIVMERIGGYRVDLEVPESYAQRVRAGQPVAVRVPSAGPAVLPGTVEVVVPAADPRSRTSVVQVGVPANETLRSGMFARADLPLAERPVMRIPAAAVVPKGQLTGVFIVDQDNTARFRLIRTGRSAGDQVDVISGLAPGTRLVAAPPIQLANGSAVEAEK